MLSFIFSGEFERLTKVKVVSLLEHIPSGESKLTHNEWFIQLNK